MIHRITTTLFSCLAAVALHSSSLAEDIFAITQSGNLISFDSDAPGTILSTMPVTGLQSGESLVGMDFRTNTGQLFAVGNTSRVYVLNPATGAATVVGAVFAPQLSGTHFAVDFNPTVDRLRCVSETGQNLRLNPNDGTVAATDTSLAYASFDPAFGSAPRVVAVAYTNNFTYATSTTLYGIDSTRDALVTVGSLNSTVSPNAGSVLTVGKLGVDTNDSASLDISGQTGVAYAALTPSSGSASKLYTINLSSGTTSLLGTIAAGDVIKVIAVAPAPVQYDIVVLRTGTPSTLARIRSEVASLASVNVTVTGLQAAETLVGIRYRPANGVLYGFGTTGRLYIVDAVTGAATLVGASPISPNLASTNAGIAFNPVADRLRVVDDADENLRVNPDTGALVLADTALAYVAGDANFGSNPNVSAIAYTNTFAGATTTTLYAIDGALGTLATIGALNGSVSPNLGQLNTVGALGVAAGSNPSIDVAPDGTLFAALSGSLYRINAATGASTLLTTIGGGTHRAIAVVPASALPKMQFSAAAFRVNETNTATVTVTRSGNTSGTVSVDYAVTPDSTDTETNLDTLAGTLTFLHGETARTILVPTADNKTLNLLLTASLTLSNPIGAQLGTQSSSTLTIGDVNDRDGDGFPNDVETAAGTNADDIASTPFGGQPAGTASALTVTRTGVKLNFAKPNLDSVSFKGSFANALTPVPPGATFIVELGHVAGKAGIIQVFTFDSKGKAPKGLTFSKPVKGISKFSVSLSKRILAAAVADAGLLNADLTKVTLKFESAVYFNQTKFAATPNVLYTAKPTKSGVASLKK